MIDVITDFFSKGGSLSDLKGLATNATVAFKFLNSLKGFIDNLKANPDSSSKKKKLEAEIEEAVEGNPQEMQEILQQIVDEIKKVTKDTASGTSITNSTNVNTGNVNTQGGAFVIGNNNFYGKD